MPNVLVNDDSLKAIGNAIREKNGETTKYKPAEMAAAITAISGGGEATIEALSITSNGTYNAPDGVDGYNPITVNVPQDGAPTDDELKIVGKCEHRFANDNWNWIIEKYGNRITTQSINEAGYMFSKSQKLKSIPFKFNAVASYEYKFNDLFYQCNNLRSIPDDFFNFTSFTTMASKLKSINCINIFQGCYSLRKIPSLSFLSAFETIAPPFYFNFYYNTFSGCYNLDEIIDLPVTYSPPTNTNLLQHTFDDCGRLKRLTFGTVYNQGKWSKQVIDLTKVGIVTPQYATTFNSGITQDKEVKNDATYQALKNDPDWFSNNIAYSRYNHDSAVETINSLPDCSEYAESQGINTIKFKGNLGSKTDGGAINTLTEEEIAVATAKGWTVTLS